MRKVELEMVKAHELDPNKKYLIELDSHSWSMKDAHSLAEMLRDLGVEVAIGIRRSDQELKLVELPQLS